jgi:small-conductance mechanosensitive channel
MSYEKLLENLNELILQSWDYMIVFIPKLIFAFLLFAFGFIIARFFQAILNRSIRNIDRWITSDKIKSKIKYIRLEQSARILSKLLYWIILIFFITLATEILGLPIISSWLSGIIKYLPNILAAIVIIFVGMIGSKLIRDFIIATAQRTGMLYGDMLGKVAYYTILFISILIALDQVGIDIAILTLLINIIVAVILLGVALAFANGASTSINNILASYYLQATYHVGDTIKIGDTEGKIIQIKSTAVVLDTPEGQVSIPAKEFSEVNSILIKKD